MSKSKTITLIWCGQERTFSLRKTSFSLQYYRCSIGIVNIEVYGSFQGGRFFAALESARTTILRCEGESRVTRQGALDHLHHQSLKAFQQMGHALDYDVET